MSHCRKNLVSGKVVGKKRIYLEKHTPQTRVWAVSEGKSGTRVGGCQFL